MGNALAAYGRPGLEALIELIRDRCCKWLPARIAIEGGLRAAASDLGLRARLAEAIREVFVGVVEEARGAMTFEEELLEEPLVDEIPLVELDEEEFEQLAGEDAATPGPEDLPPRRVRRRRR